MTKPVTINFYDHDGDQNGHAYVRPYGGRVTIGLSVETRPGVEVQVEREVVEELIEALRASIAEAA